MDKKQINYSVYKNHPLFLFFEQSLQEMYWVEKTLLNELKSTAKLVYSETLKESLERHYLETHQQVMWLELIFEHLNFKLKEIENNVFKSLMEENKQAIQQIKEDNSFNKDAIICLGNLKVEHLEVSCYEGLLQLALTFEMKEVTKYLQKILDQENQTIDILNKLIEEDIYIEVEEDLKLDHKKPTLNTTNDE